MAILKNRKEKTTGTELMDDNRKEALLSKESNGNSEQSEDIQENLEDDCEH